jgi:hypothetical protein
VYPILTGHSIFDTQQCILNAAGVHRSTTIRAMLSIGAQK